jgi:DNA-directed RNA polymerase specialized sigma24 family protein
MSSIDNAPLVNFRTTEKIVSNVGLGNPGKTSRRFSDKEQLEALRKYALQQRHPELSRDKHLTVQEIPVVCDALASLPQRAAGCVHNELKKRCLGHLTSPARLNELTADTQMRVWKALSTHEREPRNLGGVVYYSALTAINEAFDKQDKEKAVQRQKPDAGVCAPVDETISADDVTFDDNGDLVQVETTHDETSSTEITPEQQVEASQEFKTAMNIYHREWIAKLGPAERCIALRRLLRQLQISRQDFFAYAGFTCCDGHHHDQGNLPNEDRQEKDTCEGQEERLRRHHARLRQRAHRFHTNTMKKINQTLREREGNPERPNQPEI